MICIKLPHGFKTFVLSIFEWPLKTGFTVQSSTTPDSGHHYRKKKSIVGLTKDKTLDPPTLSSVDKSFNHGGCSL